jgi:outer membrane receptor protein involved in Fe transport
MKLPTVSLPGLARALILAFASPVLLSVYLYSQAAARPSSVEMGKNVEVDPELVILEKFEVVGSRIKRIDAETVSPVVQIHGGELKSTGFVSISDALRSYSFNSGQAVTTTDAGSNFAPGVSTMNLRGLGNNQTLVLINGRRAAPYSAPAFDGFQTVFDLNSIPDAAIDSVEILKDGGSAIYGSDAVAGVVNFKMKRDFQGGIAKVKVGNYFDTGGLLKQGTLTYGVVKGKTSVLTVVDWQQSDPVFARDLGYTGDANKEADAGKTHPRYRGTGWDRVDVPNPDVPKFKSEAEYVSFVSQGYGLSIDPVADSRAGWAWFDQRSSRGYPGYVVTSDGNWNTYDSPTSQPTLDAVSTGPGYNPYNYQVVSGLFPKEERLSLFSTIRHEFSAKLYMFADVSFSRVKTEVHSAPTPVDLENEYLIADNDGSARLTDAVNLMIPADNPYNPFGEDLFSGRCRLVEMGNRISDISSDTPRVVLGLGGALAGLDKWTWETAALYSRNRVNNMSKGVVTDDCMQKALLGLTRDTAGSLAWNPATPVGERVYFNWFGPSDPGFVNFLTTENPNRSELEYLSFDFNTSGTVCDLPAGPVGLSVGAEHRQENFLNECTALNATANIVSGSEGTSSKGDRSVTSVYGELNVPVVKRVEMQLAGRFEKYSDEGFGQSVRPKVGLKFRPTDWLLLRASFSKSFKAPDLAYLYTSSKTTFTGSSVWDPLTQTQLREMKIVTVGNPGLKPELTDSWYAGVVIEPKGALKNLQVSVDGFRYAQQNILQQPSYYMGYSNFLTEAARPSSPYYGRVFRDTPAPGELYGPLLYIRDDFANLSNGVTQGVDFAANYHWATASLGDIMLGATATWYDKVEVDGEEYVGSQLNARWNATASLGWRRGNWEANCYGVFKGGRTGRIDLGTVFGASDFASDADYVEQPDDFFVEYDIRPQFTLNSSVSYKGFKKLTVTVGVNNLLNSRPPLDPQEATGTTAGVNDPQPAFWYLSLEREF